MLIEHRTVCPEQTSRMPSHLYSRIRFKQATAKRCVVMTGVQCVRCYRKTTGDTGLCRPCYSMVFPDLFEASHPDKQRRRVCSDCSKHLVQPPEKQCEDCKRKLKKTASPNLCIAAHTGEESGLGM